MPETWNLTTDKNQRIIRRERVIFDFPKLYHALKAWAKPHQYELVEKAFEEKVKSTGKQYVIQLEYARKFTEFVKSEISVEIVIKDMMDVMLQDNPHTLNKGNIELVITSKMIMDYKDNFQKSPFLKALRNRICFQWLEILQDFTKV